MRILFISNWYPFPPQNGSALRIANLLRGLAEEHIVSLLSFADAENGSRHAEAPSFCELAGVIKRPEYNPRDRKALVGFLSSQPRVVRAIRSDEMSSAIRKELNSRNHDLVIASQWNMAAYADDFSGRPAIFEEVELGALLSKREQARSLPLAVRHTLPLIKMRRYMRKLLPRFGAATVASDREAEVLHDFAPEYEKVKVIPNFVDLDSYDDPSTARNECTLLFAGSMSYLPNWDAMLWFIGEIFPTIRGKIPQVELVISGDGQNQKLPSEEGVVRAGMVPDVRSLVSSATISVVPLRYGGGTRLKVLEAMVLRSPVVSTSKGVEGLDVIDEEHLLIADEPQAFADAVLRLLRSSKLRRRLAENAFGLLRQQYEYSTVMPQFLELVHSVAQ